jgi:hypothetical protein
MSSNCANPDYNAKYQDKEYRKKKEREFQPINNNSDVAHIQYGILIKNNNTGYDSSGNTIATVGPVQCSFSQNRQAPYLNNAEEYDVTVQYLNLDSNSFPNQIVQPVVGSIYQTILAAGNYSIKGYKTIFGGFIENITGPGTKTPFNIYWYPQDDTISLPVPIATNVTTDDISKPYFFNYSYSWFIDLLNQSIGYTCSGLSFSGNYPYFSYDPVTKKISVNASVNTSYWNQNGGSNKFFLNLNPELYNLFGGLPSTYQQITGTGIPANTYVYRLVIASDAGNTNLIPYYGNPSGTLTTPPTQTDNFIKMTQDYISLPVWNPVVSIVLLAKNLAVINQYVAQPQIFGINPNPPSNQASVSNVLFEIGLAKRADPTIYYEPTAAYVLTNLLGITEVYDLQFDVYWKDGFGNLYPFNLEADSTFVIKLLFRQKAFNY